MRIHDVPRKTARLCLTALLTLAVGAGSALSLGAGSPGNESSDEPAAQARQTETWAVTPLDAGESAPIFLSPDGASVLTMRDGIPAVASLDEDLVKAFWPPPPDASEAPAARLRSLADRIDPDRVAWTSDGNHLAFAFPSGAPSDEDAVWLIEIDPGSIRPLGDVRIATEDNPELFGRVESVAFHPEKPLLYFLITRERLLSRLLSEPLPPRAIVYHYNYADDAPALLVSTVQARSTLHPLHADGQSLAWVTADAQGAELLAWAPLQPLYSLDLPLATGASPSAWADGSAKLADTRSGVAALIFEPGEANSGVALVTLPKARATDAPKEEDEDAWDQKKIRPTQAPIENDIGGVALPVAEWTRAGVDFLPGAAAFSPDGTSLAVLGMAGERAALYILDAATGSGGAVDLSALTATDSADSFYLQWSAGDRLLIGLGNARAVCALEAR